MPIWLWILIITAIILGIYFILLATGVISGAKKYASLLETWIPTIIGMVGILSSFVALIINEKIK